MEGFCCYMSAGLGIRPPIDDKIDCSSTSLGFQIVSCATLCLVSCFG